jgi:hypothetical protein
MGPSIRPFAYRRDPWWDVDGRSSRRRRRRRLAAWALLVALSLSLGAIVGEARAASADAASADAGSPAVPAVSAGSLIGT